MRVSQLRWAQSLQRTRINGPLLILVFSVLSGFVTSFVHPADVALIMMGWCTWIALIDPVAGVATSLCAGLGFSFFHTEPRYSLMINSHDDFVTTILLVGIGIFVSIVTMYRVKQAVIRLNEFATTDAMDDFLESAMRDQPTVTFAQRAFEAISGELIFIDVRLEKNTSHNLPTYDLAVWNHHKSGSHPKFVDVTSAGIAIKFENPRIWYELVFSSRRGYGTLPVRRFLLQAIANRTEEFLMARLRLETRNGHHKDL